MLKRACIPLLFLFIAASVANAQTPEQLIQQVRAKIETVQNYEADGSMKTNVPFLKVPVSDVKVYFKRPDRLKIKNEKGISLVPKGAVSMSLSSLVAGKNYTAIDAGTEKFNGITVRVIKLLPEDDNAEIVLSTMYIDAAKQLIVKARTTTRENGTYELEMKYGKYAAYALPDYVSFTFNVKEYKLPKGVTFDYDDGSEQKKNNSELKSNKGKIEITYKSYTINKGISDAVFK